MTRMEFGEMLRSKLDDTHDIVALSRWAYGIFLENIRSLDPGLREVLLDIARMEDSPQFEFSVDELRHLTAKLMEKT